MPGLLRRSARAIKNRAFRELARQWVALEVEDAAPVFVIGAPRSGTSVLAWALAQHERFWTSAESDYLMDLFGSRRLREAYRQAYARPDEGWLKKHKVSYAELAEYLGLGIHRLYLSRSEGRRWVEQTPRYTLMAGDLLLMFPSARFLHILRDGRQVANSLIHSGFDKLGVEYVKDFRKVAETWSRYAMAGRKTAEGQPDRCLEVRHEQLVADPEATFAQILGFLGEPPSPAPAEFIRTTRLNSSYDPGRKSRVAIGSAVDQAATRPSPDDWSPEQRAQFQEIAGLTMTELGYALPVEASA